MLAVAIAALLVGWPAYGVLHDDFAVPVGRLDGRDFHFHGAALWLMFAGFACQAASIPVTVAMVGAFIIMAMVVLKMMSLV